MNLIDLASVPADTILSLLHDAQRFLEETDASRSQGSPLQGKAFALLFFEPSTRTRVSFELAAKRLGASTVALTKEGSSLLKGETVLDTVRNLEAMGVDGFVIRHQDNAVPYHLAEHLEVPLVNAGNGTGEHPTQGLLDALALRMHLGDPGGEELSGKTIAIVGDIRHSRVARSDVHAFESLGAEVILCGPKNLLPAPEATGWGRSRRTTDRREALEAADAVVVLRIQRERLGETVVNLDAYLDSWRITTSTLEREMRPGAKILHPGPVLRGVELDGDVADGPQSLILEQVRCGVAVRKAVLCRMVGK